MRQLLDRMDNQIQTYFLGQFFAYSSKATGKFWMLPGLIWLEIYIQKLCIWSYSSKSLGKYGQKGPL